MFLSEPAETIFVPSYPQSLLAYMEKEEEVAKNHEGQARPMGYIVFYLGKVTVKHGLCVLVCMSALALAILGDFVDADFVVPTGNGQEIRAIRRWRE